jgi:peptidoglycan/LPS O-acetylase OafA/YrhL
VFSFLTMPTYTSPNPLQPTPSSRHRFHLLDGLRGVASILVVYWHAPAYLWSRGNRSNYLAVDFFFCLSGFIVAFAYERRLIESLNFKRFLLARVIRLYPTYLLAVLLGLPIFFATGIPHPTPHALYGHIALLVPTQLFLMPNIGIFPDPLLFPVLNPGWSLFFELLASAAFGALVRLRRASTPYLITIYVIALLIMIHWSRVHHTVSVGWSSSFKSPYAGIARVGLTFTAGILLQRVYRRKEKHTFAASISGPLALVITSVLIFILFTPFALMQTSIFQVSVLALWLPCLVLLGSFCRVPKWCNRLCAFLGDVSYPLYLLHYPALMLFNLSWIRTRLATYPFILPFVIPLVIVSLCALSYLVQVFYDIPVRNFLTRRLNSASDNKPAPLAYRTEMIIPRINP